MAATAVKAVKDKKSGAHVPVDIKTVFDKFDNDGSNSLDFPEVAKALQTLIGSDVPQQVVQTAIKQFAKPGEEHLDCDTFADLVSDLRASREKYVALKMHDGSILGPDKKLPGQDMVWRTYNKPKVVALVAFVIVSNFAINVVEKEIDPDQSNMKYADFWATMDTIFNIIFIFELWANMWGHGGPVRVFFKNGWNVFDTIIVLVGFLTMVGALGPPLDKLKLLRAFRVFRLFKRIKSLNKIIVALINSVPGVINAFVVMFIFFCIYAILAVELFRDFGKDGIYHTWDENGHATEIDGMTGRGFEHGIEYYGTFMRALYTLFQVMTGESWSEAVARPLLFGLYQENSITVGIYFVSFIILMQMVLINVVVAVLLDKFVADEPEDLAEMENTDAGHKPPPAHGVDAKLEWILSNLAELKKSVAECQEEIATMPGLK